MITYVNDVFVSNVGELIAADTSTLAKDKAEQIDSVGKLIIADMENPNVGVATVNASAKAIRIGLVTKKVSTVIEPDGTMKFAPVIDWTNPIQKDAIKNFACEKYQADEAEKVAVNFAAVTDVNTVDKLKTSGHSVVLRIVYKDMNTRYRKWTESYEYVTKEGDTVAKISKAFEAIINKDHKRARVIAKDNAGVLTLEAMPYDDDNSVNSISPAATVRFSVSVWVAYNDIAGISAIGSNKKVSLPGLEIKKTPGKVYTASAKYVRDREAAAMGYDGILNRGNGTLIEANLPELNVKLDGRYDAITLQFENMYRSADDLHRIAKQSVEIYPIEGKGAAIKTALAAFVPADVNESVASIKL